MRKTKKKTRRDNESISYKGLASKENADAFSSLARRTGKHWCVFQNDFRNIL